MTEVVLVFWYWWVLAIICLVIEILVPTFFFLWMSVSGLITGIIIWLMPSISTDIQIMIFSVLTIMTITVWRIFGKKYVIETDQPLLNRRGSQYVGRVFNLHEAIENGEGKIKVDDTIWKVHGEDCDINTKVKVIASRNTVFDVEKVM
ncbi:MAG: NfeD family protein [Methylococcales bacterium]|nr:NfeD family protein [Methylococcales bacterium]MDP3335003.1 NfeD family protein [Methylococcaceae bacterium]MDP3838079.1 NfeD family protein [Methylococcales bacterium]